ncbi:hypothetical protein Y1Q_0008692 [Alligator mississippiensis]|uniref:Uncharacterized protein n=1 Tax=Alligator mississippiensis TaxID=8496 RepID=A0A151N9L5_ALLMI|nr:hypothetical protein Y1Q_0008692 [Alligator mississippiensis]
MQNEGSRRLTFHLKYIYTTARVFRHEAKEVTSAYLLLLCTHQPWKRREVQGDGCKAYTLFKHVQKLFAELGPLKEQTQPGTQTTFQTSLRDGTVEEALMS